MFTATISPGRVCRRALLTAGVSIGVSLAACSAFAASPIPVRVGSISAADPNLAHAVKETLVTDLAKSDRLTLLAGSNVPTSAPAAYTLTGSCLFVDQTVIINLRMVNAAGHTVPGAAENVEGPRSEVFKLVHSLAAKFTTRLAGGSTTAASPRPSSKHVELAVDREEAEIPPAGAPLEANRGSDRPSPRVDSDREERSGHYTSVIIDARGLGLERSMSPRIRRKDGSTVYDGGDCTPDFAIEKGVVGYACRMSAAREMDRAGSRPLIIEAKDRYDQPLSGDPLISDEDAEFLARAGRRDGFFKKFNVIFLIDK